jgi:hypothetical protein
MLAPIYLRPTFHSYATDEQREFVERNVDNLRAIAPDCLNICVSIPLSHNVRKMVFEFVYAHATITKSFTSVQSQINEMKTVAKKSAPAQQQTPKTVNIKLQQTFIDNASTTEAFEVGSSSDMIRAFATQVGADRVYVTKTLTNGSRPLTLRFYDRSRFVTNRTLNYIAKKAGK